MGFDIAPFALPGGPPGEIRFEEPRNVAELRVFFKAGRSALPGLSYLRRYWPEFRREDPQYDPMDKTFSWGWFMLDDQFTGAWQKAAVEARLEGEVATLSFRPLSEEMAAPEDYEVRFRHTLGLRIDGVDPGDILRAEVYTNHPAARSRLRVELDAGKASPSRDMAFSGYNAVIEGAASGRLFTIGVSHMDAPGIVDGDEGLVGFGLGDDTFTVSIESLKREGPVWYEELGFYITDAANHVPFEEYRKGCRKKKTIRAMVKERPEQSFSNAHLRQPRPHVENACYILGGKYARQTFRVSANGDLLLDYFNVQEKYASNDTPRFRNDVIPNESWWPPRSARFFFGLERWFRTAIFSDPAPILAFNVHVRKNALQLEQKSIALPLLHPLSDPAMRSDATMVALLRFRFRNSGDAPARAELPVEYSQCARKTEILGFKGTEHQPQDDYIIPAHLPERLIAKDGRIYGSHRGEEVLRCAYEAGVDPEARGERLVFSRQLASGEDWDILLKVPYIAIDRAEELAALEALDFERSYGDLAAYWRGVRARGAQIRTPIPQINELYGFSLAHLQVTDLADPGDPLLILSSTGASTYKDYPKETVLQAHHLDERGLHEEARRRYSVWLKYQGGAGLPGMFTDREGVFFGSGGFEGMGYNQHHGWVMWGLAEHLALTGDRPWYRSIAPAVLAAVDWVARQRATTMVSLPHSRGWERGFLPAGALEDIEDFNYWISTNILTWRGVDASARALEEIGHEAGSRVRGEAEAYKADLIRGLETMRRHTPVVRLRDGRWVPDYPSRPYRRGRDVGWTREVYEGSIFMLISGLYDPCGKEAGWIVDDYQDNRYTRPPYAYHIYDFESNWFSRAGACPEPNYFPDVLPYLDRDEAEVYMWMFFNAWNFVWEEELCCMTEHPAPFLGYHNLAMHKISEELGALSWLQYMFVYAKGGTLHLGKALPRAWLAGGEGLYARGIATRFGEVGIEYEADPERGEIRAELDLALREDPARILLRFRHPEGKPILSATVDGRACGALDREKGDIDITGLRGSASVVARF